MGSASRLPSLRRADESAGEDGGTVSEIALASASSLGFGDISVVAEDGDYLVGDPQLGVFLSVPEVGVVALRALAAGATVREAAAEASAFAEQDVNVLEFAEALVAAGLVRTIDGRPLGPELAAGRRNWLAGISPAVARPFFSAPAWALYAVSAAFSIAVFVARPALWPTFEDAFFYPNPAVCVAAVTASMLVIAALHEGSHWLAARAEGVSARFAVSRRLFVPVFETDLSQLWSVPRRRRYGPFLAGMALNSLLLAACLSVRFAWSEGAVDVPPLLVRFLGTLVLLNLVGIAFQAFMFVRTDLYAVLITALGCRNLYRVNLLTLKRPFGLSSAERAELEAAHPRDLRVARWFAVFYALGLALAGWYFVRIFFPGTVIFAGWMFHSLTGAPPESSAFWQALVVGSISALQVLVPLVVFVRERRGP
jgi:hypothetical protein